MSRKNLLISLAILLVLVAIPVALYWPRADRVGGVSAVKSPAASVPSVGLDAERSVGAYGTGGPEGRALVKSFSMTLRAAKVEATARRAADIARKYAGYVQTESYGTSGGGPVEYARGGDAKAATGAEEIIQAYLELRIPSDRVEDAIADLEKLGTVDAFNRNVSDVTQPLTEIEIRLENKRAEVRRLEDLFERAGSVKEVLEVERELARVREEIQVAENELRTLREQVSYSIVAVTILKPSGVVEPGFEFDWKQLIRDFIAASLDVVRLIFRVAGFLAPIAVLALIGYAIWRVARRRATP